MAIESSRNAEICQKIRSSLLAYVSSMSWWKMYISQFFWNNVVCKTKQNTRIGEILGNVYMKT